MVIYAVKCRDKLLSCFAPVLIHQILWVSLQIFEEIPFDCIAVAGLFANIY